MLSLMLLFSTARATSLEDHVMGTLGLMTLARRMETPVTLHDGDPDRALARHLFRMVGYPGAVSRIEQRPGAIETPPYSPTAQLLGVAFANDGHQGTWGEIATRLRDQLVDIPRADLVPPENIAREIAQYVLIPSPAARRVSTPTQTKVQIDLVTALGRSRQIAAVPTLQWFVRGASIAWPELWTRPEFPVVVAALSEIEPVQALTLVALALDADHPHRTRILREAERRLDCAARFGSPGRIKRAWRYTFGRRTR